jgi:ribonuclease HI
MTKKAAKKSYVVFNGKKPGIYDTWPECQEQTKGVKGAKYKAFEDRDKAIKEFEAHQNHSDIPQEDFDNSINVDASTLGNPGIMEYRCTYTISKEVIFDSEKYEIGTNNIGEFLALVDAMKYLKDKNELERIIFTDSVTAMSWVKNKAIKTTLEKNKKTEKLYKKIDESIAWLLKQDLDLFLLRKWPTEKLGNPPSDYGRK